MSWKFWQKKSDKAEKRALAADGIDGAEEYRLPLPTINITYIFCTLKELNGAKNVQMIAEELDIQPQQVADDLEQLTKDMVDGLTCILEYPYVDEYYRDAYYSFYSRKHNSYNRNCFRVSFFIGDVTEDNFYEVDLNGKFLGYTVLQPTPKCIIGYTFLHPTIYKECDFAICICNHDSFVKGRKVSTTAFPYSGQDAEIKSCSENSLLMMCDYFSRRYNRYARVLPSQIADELTDSINNRQQPTHGVDIDTVVTILNINGITTRKYDKVSVEYVREADNCFAEDEFLRLLDIYVDSGFPVFMATETHALLAVGKDESKGTIIAMNDNERPYSRYENLKEVKSFIVPIADNILIDPRAVKTEEILAKMHETYPNVSFLRDGVEYVHRIFLTTSRSFKKYMVNANLGKENLELVVCTAMPKFIWVSESIARENKQQQLKDSIVDTVIVIDATDAPSAYNRLLMVKTREHLLIPMHDKTRLQRKIYSINNSTEELHPFMNNLKGSHSLWKD